MIRVNATPRHRVHLVPIDLRLAARQWGAAMRADGLSSNAIRAMLVAALVGAGGATALAQGNPELAQPLVETRCAACHEVPGMAPPAVAAPDHGPSFLEIAADTQTYSRAWLTSFLRRPHYPMTTFILTPVEVDNIVSFILQLRD
ncbi:MAG: hypothetical protein R3F55_12250 [Alphaproteobacteria bacterium]